jgi:hypothetical protein
MSGSLAGGQGADPGFLVLYPLDSTTWSKRQLCCKLADQPASCLTALREGQGFSPALIIWSSLG